MKGQGRRMPASRSVSRRLRAGAAAVLLVTGPAQAQTPVGTSFTYQGRLTDGGSPASGAYDLRFVLFDAAIGGAQVGPLVSADDVTVTNGLFTVTLDFGAVLSGSRRWLEIGVRPGASTGAYAVLSPRQELTPSPQAVFSSTAPWAGVTGKPAGFADDVDNDTTYTAGAGLGLAGTVFGIADLGVNTAKLANGAVTSAKIANGAVGLAQINTAQVQARVGGTCPAAHFLRGINADGSVQCEPLVAPAHLVSIVDAPAGHDVGRGASVAIGADGLPIVAYQDLTSGSLKVAHCGNAACSSGNVVTTVDDPANTIGVFLAIAIGADGLPVVSYQDLTAFDLKVAHCGNTTCSAGNVINIVDGATTQVGAYNAIAIGADGLPVISYHDQGAFTLKVAHCGNAACSAGNVIRTIDSPPSNHVGTHTSIAIGDDGLPIVAYHDETAGALKVAHCGNVFCTVGNVVHTLDDPPGDVGRGTSIFSYGSSPTISYWDFTNDQVNVAVCQDAVCSTPSSIVSIGTMAGGKTSLARGADFMPIISAGGTLVRKCSDVYCSTGATFAVVDATAGGPDSIAIGPDARPVIAYYSVAGDGQLRVAKCSSVDCR